jgi:hypothetical protein
MTIFARNKANYKNFTASALTLVQNMAQNKPHSGDNTVSVFDHVD